MKKLALLLFIKFSAIAYLFSQTLSYSGSYYSLTGIPYYTDNKSTTKDHHGWYKHVWYLSDGTYDYGYDTIYTGGGAIQKPYNPSGIPVWGQAELTAIYDNDDKPKKYRTVTTNPGTDPPDFQGYTGASLYMPLLPRKGDTLTYVFKYGNLCDINDTADIAIEYDSNVMEILNVDTITSLTTQTYKAPGLWRASYSGLSYNNFRQAFIQVRYKNPATTQSSIVLKIKPKNKSCSQQIDTIHIGLKAVGDPHDPNYIIGDKLKICPSPIPDKMNFGIVFQNIGAAPADSVTVKLQLPDCFLYGGQHYKPIDPLASPQMGGSNQMTWVLTKKNGLLKDGNDLRGTNESPKNFSEDDTRDSVLFGVNFDKSKPLLPCSVIPIHADIYFNNLNMVATNDYYIQIQCDSCDSCYGKLEFQTLPAVFSGSKLNIPPGVINSTTKIQWIPMLGLSDPNIADPVAKTNTDQIYYASVVEGCNRKLFKVLVKAATNPGTGGGCTNCGWKCWLLILMAVIFGAWLFRRR